jgi:hypothetical protein
MAAKKVSTKRAVKTTKKRPATSVSKAISKAKADLVARARKANPGKKLKPRDIFTATAELRLPASILLRGLAYGPRGGNSWVEIDSDYEDLVDGKDHTD